MNQDDLNKQERYFINKYDCLNRERGYNLREGGGNGNLSLETRKRMSEAQKGRDVSEKTRKKLSEALKGENHPFYGKRRSEKARRNISKNNAKYWQGKDLSEEHRRKISESMGGKKRSEETRKKMSDIQEGKGLFGFTGVNFNKKNRDPWNRVWGSKIGFNGRQKSLGLFNDPLSCEIVYKLVKEELY